MGRSSSRQRDNFSSLDALLSDFDPFDSSPVVSFERPVLERPVAVTELLEVEDRRTWHPAGDAVAARTLQGSPARLWMPMVDRYQFNVPNEVVICARRKRRREVLFAYRRTRGGAGARRRRNQWSDVSC